MIKYHNDNFGEFKPNSIDPCYFANFMVYRKNLALIITFSYADILLTIKLMLALAKVPACLNCIVEVRYKDGRENTTKCYHKE